MRRFTRFLSISLPKSGAQTEGAQSVGEAFPAVLEEHEDNGKQQEQMPYGAEEEDVEVESFQNKYDQKCPGNHRYKTR